jgi:hypothetical protein
MSLISQEGWLLNDNRAAGGGLSEYATYTCKHCCAVVVKNPARVRPRYHCKGCDHLICDACAVLRTNGEPCRTIDQIIDETQESAYRNSL